MHSDPRNTLAYNRSRPLLKRQNMRAVPVTIFRGALLTSYWRQDGASPENDAISFYALNHAVALIQRHFAPLEPLPDFAQGLCETYHAVSAKQVERAFHYLFYICLREARHNKSPLTDYTAICAEFGPSVAKFLRDITCSGYQSGDELVTAFLKETPLNCTIGELTTALQWTFANSLFEKGYGSLPWANVADCLVKFIEGDYSPEMMLDTVYTLQHNCCSIFNKGRYYSEFNEATLFKILDLQRAGQLLNAVYADEFAIAGVGVEPLVKTQLLSLRDRITEPSLSLPVDWRKVVLAGALGNYRHAVGGVYDAELKQAQDIVWAKLEDAKLAHKEHFKSIAWKCDVEEQKSSLSAGSSFFKTGAEASDIVKKTERAA